MYHSFLIHSSADGHLGCFHVLAMINSAVMNIGVHVSFKVRLFGSNSGSTIYCLYALGKLLNLSIPQLFYMLNRYNNLYHRVVVRIKWDGICKTHRSLSRATVRWLYVKFNYYYYFPRSWTQLRVLGTRTQTSYNIFKKQMPEKQFLRGNGR